MDDLTRRFRVNLHALGIADPDQPVAVALSGGADSLCLLQLATAYFRTVHALIVDHGLREGSADDAVRAAQMARDAGAMPHCLTWQHVGISSGIQARARAARYRLLAQACAQTGTRRLLTGHNANDQAETYLMRQRAGSSDRGLAGMSAARMLTHGVELFRPMLSFRRAEIDTALQSTGLQPLHDPANENTAFERVLTRQAMTANQLEVSLREVRRLGSERQAKTDRMLTNLMPQIIVSRAGWCGVPLSAAEQFTGTDELAELWQRLAGWCAPSDEPAGRLPAGIGGKNLTWAGCQFHRGRDHIFVFPERRTGWQAKAAKRWLLPAKCKWGADDPAGGAAFWKDADGAVVTPPQTALLASPFVPGERAASPAGTDHPVLTQPYPDRSRFLVVTA